MALTSAGSKGTVRALYAYLSSGEHQMSFLEGDLITLLGDESIAFHGKVHQPSPVPIVQFRRSSTDGVGVVGRFFNNFSFDFRHRWLQI